MYIIADCKTYGHSNMAEYKEFVVGLSLPMPI